MKKGNVDVQQVTGKGNVVCGKDESLSPSEIFDAISAHFPNIQKYENDERILVGNYEGNKFAIRCKNITYLGIPHPVYKKRIQISDDLFEFAREAEKMQAIPLLLGIYSNEDNLVFAEFRIDTYLKKKAHNSSAHVYISDILAATEDGFFQKEDYFGNTVTVFRSNCVDVYLRERFGQIINDEKEPESLSRGEIHSSEYKLKNKTFAAIEKYMDEKIVPIFKEYFAFTERRWYGTKCYDRMIKDNYRNMNQPEWAGFYFEYEFEKFINQNEFSKLIVYAQDKKKEGIDLDLYIPEIKTYADLKTHSIESRGIQGNDWETVFRIIAENDNTGHIYYIVLEHETEKDNIYDYEVTKMWNTFLQKDDIMSYHKRMKHNVTLRRVYFLDINCNNSKYLSKYKQGVNSNGKPRAPKIMIEQDNLSQFIIEEIEL